MFSSLPVYFVKSWTRTYNM